MKKEYFVVKYSSSYDMESELDEKYFRSEENAIKFFNEQKEILEKNKPIEIIDNTPNFFSFYSEGDKYISLLLERFEFFD